MGSSLKIIPAPWNLFGILLILIGIFFELAGERLFHQAGTTITPYDESQVLVTRGVFHVTRNPMYTGIALILFGAAMLFGTLTPFLVVPACMFLIEVRFIRVEEKMLESKFGGKYLEYKKEVRRWI